MTIRDGLRVEHDCGPCPAVPLHGGSHRLHAVRGSIARPAPAGCVVCGDPVPSSAAHGPEPRYCGPRCHQRAYTARKGAAA